MIQHMVMFKWKPNASVELQSEARSALDNLAQIAKGLVNYSAGTQSSPEGLGKGFEFGFVMTFKDAAARDAYLIHPEHKKLVAMLQPLLEDVMVLDYQF